MVEIILLKPYILRLKIIKVFFKERKIHRHRHFYTTRISKLIEVGSL